MASSDRPRIVVLGGALDGPYAKRIHRRIRAAGLDGWMEFKGRVDHDTVISFLSTSMACLAPSRFENGARMLVEAMALGCPVVASDIPAFREACGEGATYFRVGDDADLATSLVHLMTDAASRDALARAGEARVSSMSPSSASQVVLEELERSVT